jgi:hypothetical protein
VDGRFLTREAFAPVRPGAETAGSADAVAAAVDDGSAPLHEPLLEPRDEAVFLLTVGAEIEQALMVQYLFAAYSVRPGDSAELRTVQRLLTEIAREEMGHLATVQNLLHLIGGPLTLDRDRAPYASDVHPFRFALEPMTLASLAKYVSAERPAPLPTDLPQADAELVGQLAEDAAAANGGVPVRQVGPIYRRIAHLLEKELTDGDFRLTTAARHARDADWGYVPSSTAEGEALIVVDFPGTTATEVRTAAVAAVRAISEQGEGFDLPPAGADGESHFERFLDIYKRVSVLVEAGTTITWPLATNPNTTQADPPGSGAAVLAAVREADLLGGRITIPRTRLWAQLFNARYRLLLGKLLHFLRLDQELYSATAGPTVGDRTERGLLLRDTFDEMRHLSTIAAKLVQLPCRPSGALHAGPTFELPYSLNLPDGEPQRWRTHLDALRAANHLTTALLTLGPDPFLEDLVLQDAAAEPVATALAAGAPIPADALPRGFAKTVTILEEAVRGFTVGNPHGEFWAGVTREAFLATTPVGAPPVALLPDGSVDPDPDHSPLVHRLEGTGPGNRMPRRRPAVPAERVTAIRDWISAGAPDDVPPDGIGVRHEPAAAPE